MLSSLLHRRVTRRSAFLILFGTAYIFIGLSYIVSPVTESQHRQMAWILSLLPLSVLGALWVICGLIAVHTGLTRWHKEYGFGSLSGIGLFWGGLYAFGLIHHFSSAGVRGWLIWWLVSAAVHIVAGLADPRR